MNRSNLKCPICGSIYDPSVSSHSCKPPFSDGTTTRPHEYKHDTATCPICKAHPGILEIRKGLKEWADHDRRQFQAYVDKYITPLVKAESAREAKVSEEGTPRPPEAPLEPIDIGRVACDRILDAVAQSERTLSVRLNHLDRIVKGLETRQEQLHDLVFHATKPPKTYARCEKCGALNFYDGSGTWGCGICDADLVPPPKPFSKAPPCNWPNGRL